MKKNDFGVWELTLPAKNGVPAIAHNSKIKVSLSLRSIDTVIQG
jgi:1,4-alpha-glucan branching enzyme